MEREGKIHHSPVETLRRFVLVAGLLEGSLHPGHIQVDVTLE